MIMLNILHLRDVNQGCSVTTAFARGTPLPCDNQERSLKAIMQISVFEQRCLSPLVRLQYVSGPTPRHAATQLDLDQVVPAHANAPNTNVQPLHNRKYLNLNRFRRGGGTGCNVSTRGWLTGPVTASDPVAACRAPGRLSARLTWKSHFVTTAVLHPTARGPVGDLAGADLCYPAAVGDSPQLDGDPRCRMLQDVVTGTEGTEIEGVL